jgi:hypothetical protein
MRNSFKVVSVVVAWFALCSAAFAADNQVMTASASVPLTDPQPSGAVSTNSDDQTARQIDAWLSNDGASANQGGPQGGGQGGAAQPRAIHGEAGASIGSNGYRNAYVAADIPVGQNSDLGVAVSDTQLPSRHGYGGGSVKSLGISLSINTANGGGGSSCGPQHWGQQLPTDHIAPACLQGDTSGLAPGLAAMAAESANR